MDVALCFTNIGPYHRARLRALGRALRARGDRLLAYEVAGREERYPWRVARDPEPFRWETWFPGRSLEGLASADAAAGMVRALDRDDPAAVAIVGYARPESVAALDWCGRKGRPVLLLSESQAIDRPRVWWKEAVKRRRVRRCAAALVGGPSHRDYLEALGMPAHRIVLGYNAVDNRAFAEGSRRARMSSRPVPGRPDRPFFLAVARFAPEKNLERLIWAFARYRQDARPGSAWDLVLCGGGETGPAIASAAIASGCAEAVHRPGFLQAEDLYPFYAAAGALVLPSVSEPWGLVANEAAASGLPLLVSDRAGCAATLVPDPPGTTGRRFDPIDHDEMAAALAWIAGLDDAERLAMGRRAAEVVSQWGPERFASGFLEALEIAQNQAPTGERRNLTGRVSR